MSNTRAYKKVFFAFISSQLTFIHVCISKPSTVSLLFLFRFLFFFPSSFSAFDLFSDFILRSVFYRAACQHKAHTHHTQHRHKLVMLLFSYEFHCKLLICLGKRAFVCLFVFVFVCVKSIWWINFIYRWCISYNSIESWKKLTLSHTFEPFSRFSIKNCCLSVVLSDGSTQFMTH